MTVELVNFVVYIFAAILLYYEYVRLVSEAWYCHKLFAWSNLVLHGTHLAVFFELHAARTSHVLGIARCLILIALVVTQWITKRKTPRYESFLAASGSDRMEILRSNTIYSGNSPFR